MFAFVQYRRGPDSLLYTSKDSPGSTIRYRHELLAKSLQLAGHPYEPVNNH